MTIPACTDPKTGSMLFAYEVGALESGEIDRFELHLLECGHCFQAAKRFESYAKRLREDELLREEVTRTAGGDVPLSFWERVRRNLWPPLPYLLRPALAYLIIAALLYPALKWISHSPPKINPVQVISLSPHRSTGNESFSLDTGLSGVISFFFPGGEPGKAYRVLIKDSDGTILYYRDDFSAFDSYETGWLEFACQSMAPGDYKLEVYDLSGESPEYSHIYQFEITQ
jgi:hypothetical protein